MKIAVNTRFLLANKLEGIGIYTQEIFKRVVQLMPEHEFYFLFDRPYAEEFIFAKNVFPIVVPPPARHPFLWYWWFEKSIPKTLKALQIDLFISPDGFCSLSTNVPQILTIHDLGFAHFPNHTPFLVRNYYNHFVPKYCEKANKIVAVSAFTQKDIEHLYSIDANKIEVVYNGFEKNEWAMHDSHLNNISTIDKRLSTNLPYFIFVGAVHPRKNVLGLLKAYEHFKSNYHHTHQLVIVGRKAWKNTALENYFKQMKFKKDVIRIEEIERINLIAILQQAFALVYPSFFEGFGIPLVEAMSLGVPVIASNSSAIPEVVVNAGILVNPNKTEEISEAMNLLVVNDEYRNELVAKGKIRSTFFDWNSSAKKIVELIKKMEK